MRQWIDNRGVNRQHGIEQVGEVDAERLGDESEESTVRVEISRRTGCRHFEIGLVRPVEKLIPESAFEILEGQLDGIRPKPLDVDDHDRPGGPEPSHLCAASQVFESSHLACCLHWLVGRKRRATRHTGSFMSHFGDGDGRG